MANEEQLEIFYKGVTAWNFWREENPGVTVDLSGADLSESLLGGINLSKAHLHRTNFTRAHLAKANLRRAQLHYANLSESNLLGANLSLAEMIGANLTRADLSTANLDAAVIAKARLSNSFLGNTLLTFINLSEAIDLDTVVHYGSSSLGTDTIMISKGRIPLEFLRGCGLSNLDIEYAKLAQPGLDPEQVTDITYKIHQLYFRGGIQYYSCFISYNSKDEEFARKLHDDLQNNGVRCWFAPEDLKIGDQIRPRIDQEIRLRDKLLVILSENSIKSEWVGDEVEGAIEEESKGNRLVLFPIRLDDTVLNTRDDWAAKIKRRRHIGDFSNWRDKVSYQKAFERLLSDLKATGGG